MNLRPLAFAGHSLAFSPCQAGQEE